MYTTHEQHGPHGDDDDVVYMRAGNPARSLFDTPKKKCPHFKLVFTLQPNTYTYSIQLTLNCIQIHIHMSAAITHRALNHIADQTHTHTHANENIQHSLATLGVARLRFGSLQRHRALRTNTHTHTLPAHANPSRNRLCPSALELLLCAVVCVYLCCVCNCMLFVVRVRVLLSRTESRIHICNYNIPIIYGNSSFRAGCTYISHAPNAPKRRRRRRYTRDDAQANSTKHNRHAHATNSHCTHAHTQPPDRKHACLYLNDNIEKTPAAAPTSQHN